MAKINRIKIVGFRRFLAIDLPVRQFMVLIGANSVGKTSLLDAFTLLSASAEGNLNKTLSDFGGLTSLLTRGKASELSFQVNMPVPGHEPMVYELHLTPKGASYNISREILSQLRQGYTDPFLHIESSYGDIRYYEPIEKRIIRPSWDHNPLESSLAQVPRMFPQPEEFRRLLATATHYHLLDVGPQAPVKSPQQMKPAMLPGPSGEDLIPFLYYLRETEIDRFEAVVDSLRVAFPDFQDLAFPPVAAGRLSMTWKDKKFSKPFYPDELSEGTLRFLWLIALLHSPALTTLTLIDEPEVSLHPELLSLLAEVMREASSRTQLIVATHSDRFIRFLKPEEVVVLDFDETGCTTATWADTMDLDHWLAEYSLDEVWRLGRMGGRS